MKLTVFQFEGTPEELDASQAVRDLTDRHRGGLVTTPARQADSGIAARIPGVPDEGQETIRALLRRSPSPELFTRFLTITTAWENVGVHGIRRKDADPGDPLDYSRYLRLRRQGSQFGGFAYVWTESSSVNLRLDLSTEALKQLGITSARVLNTGHRAYRVSVDLTDSTSLDEALRLAELAYDAT